MATTNNGDYVYATAVPVAVPETSVSGSSKFNSSQNNVPELQREGSSYRLPPGKQANEVNQGQIRHLKQQGFTTGLAKALSSNNKAFPLRIWVVDNSGSMNKSDGHRIVATASKENVKLVPCTRWEEIRECIQYHIQMSALLRAPTTFRLLNDPGPSVGPQQFGVAEMGEEIIPRNVQEASEIMRKASPRGCTPLTRHIIEIQESIRAMTTDLVQKGGRVAIIIATDGLPTDEYGYGGPGPSQQFVDALRLLERLPVWVVIRLCTDDDDVVEFYNSLDEQLELSLEVLDDFVAEAMEVHRHNKWLNYALPLHRCREMGFHHRVFDMLDERTLSKGELRDFCELMFGEENFDGIPDPYADWPGFSKAIERLLYAESTEWNPVKKVRTPWIDVKKLNKTYDDNSSCCMM